jgi:hypothetical protein
MNALQAISNKKLPSLPVKKVCSLLLTDLFGLLNKDGKTIQEW